MKNLLKMLARVRIFAGREMAAFKVQYFCFICSTFSVLSFIALWSSRSWLAETHLSCCATDVFYGCFDSKGSFWEPLVVCL